MKAKRAGVGLLGLLDEALAHLATFARAELKLVRKLRLADADPGTPIASHDVASLDAEAWSYLEGHQAARLQAVESKAASSLLGASLGVTVLSSVGILAQPSPSNTPTRPSWALVAAAIYFLVSGCFAVAALRVGKRYQLITQDFAEPELLPQRRAFALEQNNTLLTRRTNRLEVSHVALRNGLLAFLLAALVSRFFAAGSDGEVAPVKPTLSSSRQMPLNVLDGAPVRTTG